MSLGNFRTCRNFLIHAQPDAGALVVGPIAGGAAERATRIGLTRPDMARQLRAVTRPEHLSDAAVPTFRGHLPRH